MNGVAASDCAAAVQPHKDSIISVRRPCDSPMSPLNVIRSFDSCRLRSCKLMRGRGSFQAITSAPNYHAAPAATPPSPVLPPSSPSTACCSIGPCSPVLFHGWQSGV